jgi:hypothetical protein
MKVGLTFHAMKINNDRAKIPIYLSPEYPTLIVMAKIKSMIL